MMWVLKICVRNDYLKDMFRALLIPACFFIIGCVPSLDRAKVVDASQLLDDRQMDSVTAGAVRIDLELSAAAEGPSAVTSTQGSITSAQSTVLRIAVDPSAPEPARARLLGLSMAELIFATGKADAAGTNNVACSANLAAVGDAIYIAQSRTATAVSATCSCSGFAVGLVTQ
jgi:hypothetical protein